MDQASIGHHFYLSHLVPLFKATPLSLYKLRKMQADVTQSTTLLRMQFSGLSRHLIFLSAVQMLSSSGFPCGLFHGWKVLFPVWHCCLDNCIRYLERGKAGSPIQKGSMTRLSASHLLSSCLFKGDQISLESCVPDQASQRTHCIGGHKYLAESENRNFSCCSSQLGRWAQLLWLYEYH